MPCSVYALGGDTGPVKIGMAKRPTARLTRLQTGNPVRLAVLHAREVSEDLAAFAEALAHDALKDRRQHGEWFAISTSEAASAIDAAVLAAERGDRAKRIAVGRKKVNFEQMPARFPEGTMARIDEVRLEAETRTAFVQEAVEREIKRRERKRREGEKG